jgi:hypothetical protein
MTQNNSIWSSSRFKLLGVIVVVCGLLGGGVWLLRGWLDLFSHIMPHSDGPNMAQSDSGEPFPITLKTKVVDELGNDTDKIVEWDLNIPRAFVTSVKGENGSVSSRLHEYPYVKGGYFVGVDMQVSDDGEKVVPHYPSTKEKWVLDDNSIRLWIKNVGISGQEKWIQSPGHLECFPTIKYCWVQTSLEGWEVTFDTTKRLYNQPEKTCALVKKFLSQYTVKREIYPVVEDKTYKAFSQPKN